MFLLSGTHKAYVALSPSVLQGSLRATARCSEIDGLLRVATNTWSFLFLSIRRKSIILDCKDTIRRSRKEKMDDMLPIRLEIINQ